MLQGHEIDQAMGSKAYDDTGTEIGTVGEIYLDDETGAPAWATVSTGMLGRSESFVPLAAATLDAERLRVPYSKDTVEQAPRVSEDGHLSPEQEQELYAYYGVQVGDGGAQDQAAVNTRTGTGSDQSGTTSEQADAMTLSEERLSVTGTQSRPAGRARLRKYVVTENVTMTVPVRKEKAVLEYVTDEGAEADSEAGRSESISDDDSELIRDLSAAGEAGESPEVVLHEEVPVVTLRTEAVERVRLATEEVTEHVTVTEELRKERVAAEGDVTDGRTGQQL